MVKTCSPGGPDYWIGRVQAENVDADHSPVKMIVVTKFVRDISSRESFEIASLGNWT